MICRRAIVVSRLILRSGIEEKAKAERRMNEGRTKAERRMNEQRSKDDRTPIEEMPYLHKSHYKDTKFL